MAEVQVSSGGLDGSQYFEGSLVSLVDGEIDGVQVVSVVLSIVMVRGPIAEWQM